MIKKCLTNFKTACVLALCFLLSACYGTRVSDNLKLTTLKNKRTGVALMRATYGGRNCTTERYTLATKVGNVPFPYRNPVYIYTPRPLLWVAGPSVAQAELKAGKYYIVNYSCYIKRQYQSITLQLLPANRIVNSQTQFKDAIASFTVKPGEVVNVGRLSFANAGNVGGYGYSRTNAQVSDLTKEQYDWLAENKPNIYGKMVKRTMVRVRR